MGARDMVFTILGIDKASRTADDVGDAYDRLANRLDNFGKVGAGGLSGVAAAAVAGGAATAGAIAGSIALFGALGIASVATHEVVAEEFGELADDVVRDMKQMSTPMVPVLQGIAQEAGRTFQQIRPMIRESVAESAGHIETLADGVFGFATRAMPGFRESVRSADPVMQGFKSLLISTGDGVNEFFVETSTGAEGSGRIIAALGGIVHSSLGFFGTLFAQLSDGAPTVERLAQVFDRATDVVEDLSGGALPVLWSALGVGLDIVDGVLTVVGPLASSLGSLVGVALTASAAFKTWTAIRGIAQNAGTAMVGFVDRVREAGGESAGLRGKVGALAGSLKSPLGLAIGAAAGMLSILGESEARAAKIADDHKRAVESLADALRESNGVIDEGVRSTAAKELADTKLAHTQKDILTVARDLGISQGLVTDAYLGSADAQRQLDQFLQQHLPNLQEYERITRTGTDAEKQRQGGLTLLKFWMDENRDTMDQAAEKNRDLAGATREAVTASEAFTRALAAQQAQVLAGIDKQFAYEQSLRAIESAQWTLVDATKRHDEAVKQHGANSEEARRADLSRRDAMGSVNQAILTAIASAGELALAETNVTSEADRQRIAIEAQNQEIIRLAETTSGPLPEALRRAIGSMDQTTLAANGITVSVDKAGAAVYALPNGKTVKISAEDRATGVANAVDAHLRWLARQKYIATLTLKTAGNWGAATNQALRGIAGMLATGGPVKASETYLVGEEGPELFVPTQDGYILPADRTRQVLDDRTHSGPIVAGSPTSGAARGGVHVENLNIHALGRPFSLSEVGRGLHDAGVH